MRLASPTALIALAGMTLSLVGCAGHGLFSDAGPPPVSTATSTGGYKVGRPYKINGRWYHPEEDFKYQEIGVASWYGPGFHGRQTARGDRYDMHALTAAHRTLPMPSFVRVTNLENGRVLDLLINDRGPFADGRIIDVSKRAAQELGFYAKGTARVHVRILEAESRRMKRLASSGDFVRSPSGTATAGTGPAGEPPVTVTARVGSTTATAGLGRGGIFIQAGAFSDRGRAELLRRRLSKLSDVTLKPIRVGGRDLVRVRLGPVPNRGIAERVRRQVAAAGFPEARIVID